MSKITAQFEGDRAANEAVDSNYRSKIQVPFAITDYNDQR